MDDAVTGVLSSLAKEGLLGAFIVLLLAALVYYVRRCDKTDAELRACAEKRVDDAKLLTEALLKAETAVHANTIALAGNNEALRALGQEIAVWRAEGRRP